MSSLGEKARSAVLWNTGFNLFRDVLQFGTMLVLVRLLNPDSYGEFALVTSIVGFLSIVSHNNFIAHILQVKNEENARYQEHFTASAVIQICVFLLTNILAIVLLWWPEYEKIAPLLHIMSLTFLLEWPCELRRKMIERAFDWRRLRLLHAIGLVSSALLALTLARSGAGTYALLAPGMLVTLPFIYDLFITQQWRPNWDWSWQAYRPAWQFGLLRMGSGFASNSRQLIESSIISATLGFSAFGVLSRSVGLAQLFCNKFAMQLLSAIYPILTRLAGEGGRYERVSGFVLRLIAWVVFPIAVIFSTLSLPVVQVIYGDKWLNVIDLLPSAMLLGAMSAISHTLYMLLMSQGQTRLCLIADMFLLLGTIVILSAFLSEETAVYLLFIAGLQSTVVIFLLACLFYLKKLLIKDIIAAFIPPAVSITIGWLILTAFFHYFTGDGSINTPVFAFIWGVFFCFIYVVTLRTIFKRQLGELLEYFPAKQRIKKLLFL